MNYNDILVSSSKVESVLLFDEIAHYIKENIIDFNYDFNSFFFEEDENSDEKEKKKEKTTEEIQNQNKKILDTRKWYQKLWDGIVWVWRWITTNIKKFFLRLFKKQVTDHIFIDGAKFNKRVDSLIEEIKERNPNQELKDEDDVEHVKEIYKALANEIQIVENKIKENEVLPNGAMSNQLFAIVTNRMKSVQKSQNFYSQIPNSNDPKFLYKAYMMELNHLKFLTTDSTIKSYMYQNFKIHKSYQMLSALTDLFFTGFKVLQDKTSGNYTVTSNDVEELTNAFQRGPAVFNNSFEAFSGDLMTQALAALKLKILYVYSTDSELNIKTDNTILPKINIGKHMIQFCKKHEEMANKIKSLQQAAESSDGDSILQQDLSSSQTTYNDSVTNSIELINNYFANTELVQSNSFFDKIKQSFQGPEIMDKLSRYITALSQIMSTTNKYALKVVKISSISSDIDKRFLMLVNAQKF